MTLIDQARIAQLMGIRDFYEYGNTLGPSTIDDIDENISQRVSNLVDDLRIGDMKLEKGTLGRFVLAIRRNNMGPVSPLRISIYGSNCKPGDNTESYSLGGVDVGEDISSYLPSNMWNVRNVEIPINDVVIAGGNYKFLDDGETIHFGGRSLEFGVANSHLLKSLFSQPYSVNIHSTISEDQYGGTEAVNTFFLRKLTHEAIY